MLTNTSRTESGSAASRPMSISLHREQIRQQLKVVHQTQESSYHLYLNSLAPSGRKTMTTLLNQCAFLLGHEGAAETFDWQALSYEQVQLVKACFLELGYAVNTTNLVLSGLKAIARVSFNLHQLDAETQQRIGAIKSVRGTMKRVGRKITEEEIAKLLNACQTLKSPSQQAREHALLMIGLGAGLRCAEICALNCVDVDTQNHCLRVIQGKGSRQRQVYLCSEANEAVRQWLSYRPDSTGALFTRVLKNGQVTHQGLSASGVTYAFNSLRTLADIPSFTPHDLRRTFITRLLEENVDLNTVRQLAGHSDVSTTVKYDRRDEECQKVASQNIRFGHGKN